MRGALRRWPWATACLGSPLTRPSLLSHLAPGARYDAREQLCNCVCQVRCASTNASAIFEQTTPSAHPQSVHLERIHHVPAHKFPALEATFPERIARIEELTGHKFNDADYARAALWPYALIIDGQHVSKTQKQLAVVGDAILKAVYFTQYFPNIAKEHYIRYPQITSNAHLARVSRQLKLQDLSPHIVECNSDQAWATLVEAIIGAVFLDSGSAFAVATHVIASMGVLNDVPPDRETESASLEGLPKPREGRGRMAVATARSLSLFEAQLRATSLRHHSTLRSDEPCLDRVHFQNRMDVLIQKVARLKLEGAEGSGAYRATLRALSIYSRLSDGDATAHRDAATYFRAQARKQAGPGREDLMRQALVRAERYDRMAAHIEISEERSLQRTAESELVGHRPILEPAQRLLNVRNVGGDDGASGYAEALTSGAKIPNPSASDPWAIDDFEFDPADYHPMLLWASTPAHLGISLAIQTNAVYHRTMAERRKARGDTSSPTYWRHVIMSIGFEKLLELQLRLNADGNPLSWSRVGSLAASEEVMSMPVTPFDGVRFDAARYTREARTRRVRPKYKTSESLRLISHSHISLLRLLEAHGRKGSEYYTRTTTLAALYRELLRNELERSKEANNAARDTAQSATSPHQDTSCLASDLQASDSTTHSTGKYWNRTASPSSAPEGEGTSQTDRADIMKTRISLWTAIRDSEEALPAFGLRKSSYLRRAIERNLRLHGVLAANGGADPTTSQPLASATAEFERLLDLKDARRPREPKETHVQGEGHEGAASGTSSATIRDPRSPKAQESSAPLREMYAQFHV